MKTYMVEKRRTDKKLNLTSLKNNLANMKWVNNPKKLRKKQKMSIDDGIDKPESCIKAEIKTNSPVG